MEYKYQEIMEQITVTPEMRERILRNLRTASRFKVRQFQRWIPLAAAACLILIVGVFQIRNQLLPNSQAVGSGVENVETEVSGETPVEVGCADAEELSVLAGFPVPDITGAIPFSVEETYYALLWNELAQAVYGGADGQEIALRVSMGAEDNSGVYEVYPESAVWTVGDAAVTVKGDGGQFALAVWTLDGRSYSIYSESMLPEGTWRTMVEAAVAD